MRQLNVLLLLVVAYLVVWVQATFTETRHVLGAQFDLLPSLTVYAALRSNLPGVLAVSVLGGLLQDAISANPLGVTMLPLFVAGSAVQQGREYVLREQNYAQMILGLAASAFCPLLAVIILINIDSRPLLGWFSLWQWTFVSVTGALFTPVWFLIFDALGGVLNYRPIGQGSFRPDREIKRGRQ